MVNVSAFSLAGTSMKTPTRHHESLRARGIPSGAARATAHSRHTPRLREVSDEWLERGQRRERTFTLGHFDEASLSDSEILVALAPDGRIVGFADIVPSYQSGEGNFDMLRYVAEPKDVADFLHVSLIELFRARGCQTMTLGMAPFSGLDVRGIDAASARAMRLLYGTAPPSSGTAACANSRRSIARPGQPRYVVYATELHLPGIALAVARVGELRLANGPPPALRQCPPSRTGVVTEDPSASMLSACMFVGPHRARQSPGGCVFSHLIDHPVRASAHGSRSCPLQRSRLSAFSAARSGARSMRRPCARSGSISER